MFRKLISSHKVRRRVSWLIFAILVLPFVFYGVTTQRQSRAAGKIFGATVSLEEFEQQRRWLLRQFKNQFGQDFDMASLAPLVIQSTWDRFILLAEAKNRRIRVDDRELSSFIKKIPAFQDKGRFQPDYYKRYLESLGMDAQRFETFLRNDLTVEKLVDQVKADVSLSDADVREAYLHENEKLRATVVFYSVDDFRKKAQAAVTDEDIKQKYEKDPEAIRVPEQITVEYAGLTRQEAAAGVSTDEQALKAFYDSHPDDFTQQDGSVKPFEQVREQVKQQWVKEQTHKRLTELALDLDDDSKAKLPFEQIAQKHSLAIKSFGPVAPGNLWATGGPEPAVLQAATGLAEGELSSVIETDQAVYLARVTKRQASYIPPFEQAKEKIHQQLVDEKAKNLAREEAEKLHEELAKKLASGMRFEEILADKSGIPVHAASFGRKDPVDPIGMSPTVNSTAFQTPLGLITDVIPTGNGFAILRPEQFLEPDPKNFSAQEASLRKQTLEEKQSQRVNQYLADLRSRANLRSFLETSPSSS